MNQNREDLEQWTASTRTSIPAEGTTACRNEQQKFGSLLEHLLADRHQLTAVDQFSRTVADRPVSGKLSAAEESFERNYRALLPIAEPTQGEQYAFEVDLDRCSGCKACVTGCHSLNGLDETETWRDVGSLIGGSEDQPLLQHVTAACHHCLEPACLKGCPVDAYEKDPITGIVRHLDDQCIGCQYCTLACPYDVPKYNRSKGIVRKCDMCSDRLAVGEAPACVQACPHEAISITLVDRQKIVEDSEAGQFLPAAPDPQLTLPTTIYKTDRAFPRNMLPADYYSVSAQHAHWPLVLMLVLTQLSVGAFAVQLVFERVLSSNAAMLAELRSIHTGCAMLFGLLALGASLFHLGRPMYAFRAIIGLRHSWLSREIVAFGLFAGLAIGDAVLSRWASAPAWWAWMNYGVVLSGGIGVVCSVMIYAVTGRPCWNVHTTSIKFLLTTVLLGIATAWLTILLLSMITASNVAREITEMYGTRLCVALMLAAVVKLLFEAAAFRHLWAHRQTSMKRSAWLMIGPLSHATLARFCCGILGGVCMPLFLLMNGNLLGDRLEWDSQVLLTAVIGLLFTALLVGELLERYLFFSASASPRMPGGASS